MCEAALLSVQKTHYPVSNIINHMNPLVSTKLTLTAFAFFFSEQLKSALKTVGFCVFYGSFILKVFSSLTNTH